MKPPSSARDDLACPTLYGLRWCIKPLYRAKCGEVWPHGGGHIFVTDEQARRLRSGDYNAVDMIRSMRPVAGGEIVSVGPA